MENSCASLENSWVWEVYNMYNMPYKNVFFGRAPACTDTLGSHARCMEDVKKCVYTLM